MKILFLTQYFPPEVGAPQNRLYELAIRLKKIGVDIDIFTAMPNYPSMQIHAEYKGKWYTKEELGGLTVHRSYIYVSKNKGIVSRLLNYFSFVFTSLFFGLFKLKRYDYILCESPPLFLGISAYLLCKFKKARLIFNVSDLWPESAEKLNIVTNKRLLGLAYKLEAFLYRKSVLITGQTQGIVADIKSRFPDKKNVYWLPNGVDLTYYNPDVVTSQWKQANGFNEDDFVLLYAGILGHAQGLEIIMNAAKHLQQHDNIKFAFIGSGPEKEKLLTIKTDNKLSNVLFFDIVSKDVMPSIVQAIDATIVPLKKLDLFKGAIPSKIFENLSMKKPVLLAVDGEARELFVDQGKCALFVEPENDVDLAEKIMMLYKDKSLCISLGEQGRVYVNQKFNRNIIAHQFEQELQCLL